MRSLRPWTGLLILSTWGIVVMAALLAVADYRRADAAGGDWWRAQEAVRAARRAGVSFAVMTLALWLFWTWRASSNIRSRTGHGARVFASQRWWNIPLLTPAYLFRSLWRASRALAGEPSVNGPREPGRRLVGAWWTASLTMLVLGACWIVAYQFRMRDLLYVLWAPATLVAGAVAAALTSAVVSGINQLQDRWPEQHEE